MLNANYHKFWWNFHIVQLSEDKTTEKKIPWNSRKMLRVNNLEPDGKWLLIRRQKLDYTKSTFHRISLSLWKKSYRSQSVVSEKIIYFNNKSSINKQRYQKFAVYCIWQSFFKIIGQPCCNYIYAQVHVFICITPTNMNITSRRRMWSRHWFIPQCFFFLREKNSIGENTFVTWSVQQ